MPLLKVDIQTQMHKGKLYGSAGEEVKIISIHGEVLIVENMSGFRFPVKFDELTESPSEVCAIKAEPVVVEKSKKQAKKAVQVTQQNLF